MQNMTNLLLKLHTKVPQLKVPTYLMLSKATSPIFPQQNKKISQQEPVMNRTETLRLCWIQIADTSTLSSNWIHTASCGQYCLLQPSDLNEPGEWKILVTPKTSVQQTILFPLAMFKWDMLLIPPNPWCSSWQTQQAVDYRLAFSRSRIFLASPSCTQQCYVQPDEWHAHNSTYQQTKL